MMRSKTSITGPTLTASPVSSATSRATPASSVSPTSSAPPGRLQCPASGSCARFTRTTPAPLGGGVPPIASASSAVTYITAPVPTTGLSGYARVLLPHHLHDDPLLPLPVELGVEDLFPRPEIELARGNRHDHLMPHDRALQMRIGVVFAGLMMLVRKTRRRQLLE